MRTVNSWKRLPGNFDALNTFNLFGSDNDYGIPTLRKDYFVPEWLLPVKQRVSGDVDMKKGAVHFFVDDYHFEHVWTRPVQTLPLVKKTGRALTPDFSLYAEYPKVLQVWNTYRSRWIGCYWQSNGIEVLPSVTWADERSYEFCFAGIEKGSIVAISTVGANRPKEVRELFIAGFEKMVEVIEPELVLAYGEAAPIKLEDYVKVQWYPSYWKTMRDIVAKKKKKEENVNA